MEISDAITVLNKQVPNPSAGLPDDLFCFISTVTPLVNVDLLIKDEKGRTLLAWRDDQHAGKGWHIPGGIVRFKETLEERIKKVAETEIGCPVKYDLNPLLVKELINSKHKVRGHFISILYKCSLPSSFVPENKCISKSSAGYLLWHNSCPDNLLKPHDFYRKYI